MLSLQKGVEVVKTRNLYVKDYDEAVAALEKKTLRKSKAGIKLTKAEVAKIKKILEANGKGASISEYGGKGSGKYNIKINHKITRGCKKRELFHSRDIKKIKLSNNK